ncbi:MAG: hypothetical protein ACK5TN_15140 [Acidobacteriota bacterium]
MADPDRTFRPGEAGGEDFDAGGGIEQGIEGRREAVNMAEDREIVGIDFEGIEGGTNAHRASYFL